MSLDVKAFRNALGSYTTGVTVMTTFASDTGITAMTANSFTSLSLEPPLVMWSIDLGSTHFDIFNKTDTFAVNILGCDHKEISNTFARSGNDQVSTLEGFETSTHGNPLLRDARAVFECEVFEKKAIGDHLVIVGKVLAFNANDKAAPLLFSKGKYHGLGATIEE